MVNVSVIIPAYNASATIGNLLRALACQDYNHPFEVIVVDDGSTDDTPRIVAEYANVRYVRQDNAGPAAARNRGAELAQGQYLCFTDSDCVPQSDWISKLLNGFSASDIGVVMGGYGIANPESLLARGIHGEIIFRHVHLLSDYPKVFGSYNFCAKKEVFSKVGGFHGGYRQASGEDNDLSYRISQAGYRIYFERKALVNHHHTTLLGKYLKEQFRHGFWRAKMYADHPQMAGGDGYTFFKDIAEVPLSAACVLGLHFLVVPFLFFEIFFGILMMRKLFGGIYYGIVMFFRAFARTFGLSTGIFHFYFKKWEKKFK